VLGSALSAIDATVVGIALPTLGRDFHSSIGALQWVVNAYTLALAAFLLIGGSLGDRFGRKLIFQIGLTWFAAASAACAFSPDVFFLVAMRGLQGIGAALLVPGSLAIIEASFAPDDRGQAIGAWSGLGGLATAVGPFIGGYLIDVASWRWIFIVNLPVAAAALLISVRHLPETRRHGVPRRLDGAGAVLGAASLSGITFSLIEGPGQGWGSTTVDVMLGLGLIAAVLFLFVERHSSNPTLPLTLFKDLQFSTTNAVTLIVYAAIGGAIFLLPTELQVVAHYTPLESGIALLPVTVLMLSLSAASGRLAGRIGPRLQMSVGPIVIGAGLALLILATHRGNYAVEVLPAVIVFGVGLVITVSPLTTTAMSSAPADDAGVASAVNNDVARVGGLVAVAVLPGIAGIGGRTYLEAHSLASGFRTAVAVAAVACVAGGLLAAAGIRNPSRAAAKTTEGPLLHCALDATPLAGAAGEASKRSSQPAIPR
jgi:EmrB/QacA subfamily drug resistance transporter